MKALSMCPAHTKHLLERRSAALHSYIYKKIARFYPAISLKYSFILVINSFFASSIEILSSCAPASVICPPPPKLF